MPIISAWDVLRQNSLKILNKVIQNFLGRFYILSSGERHLYAHQGPIIPPETNSIPKQVPLMPILTCKNPAPTLKPKISKQPLISCFKNHLVNLHLTEWRRKLPIQDSPRSQRPTTAHQASHRGMGSVFHPLIGIILKHSKSRSSVKRLRQRG